MPTDPLQQPCAHLATPQERERDPDYQSCGAAQGQPCRWAARYDDVVDPPFHSERLEAAASQAELQSTLDTETFREAVLDTGLV
jgi:hypothetical protein